MDRQRSRHEVENELETDLGNPSCCPGRDNAANVPLDQRGALAARATSECVFAYRLNASRIDKPRASSVSV